MKKEQPAQAARFTALVGRFRGRAGVTVPQTDGPSRNKFGSNALKIHNKIFAMLVDDRLVVKLPRERVDAFVASGEGERFDPGHGRLMKEWLVVDPDSRVRWSSLADEALAFVGSRRK